MPALRLSEHLKRWSMELAAVSDTPRLDAEVLLKYGAGFSDVALITEAGESLNEASLARVELLIQARLNGEPIAYLTGQREFYSLQLKVNRHVLIPRPDTECLVEFALDQIKAAQAQRVLDLGTGSGAIALALANYVPLLQLVATDKSVHALSVAADNARSLSLSNIQFRHSDWYSELKGERFDLIVSNPPYIDPEDPHLIQGDVRFEPHGALVANDRGLADLRQIIVGATSHLAPGGRLILEHGYDQAKAVCQLLLEAGFKDVKTLQDYGQNDRVSTGLI